MHFLLAAIVLLQQPVLPYAGPPIGHLLPRDRAAVVPSRIAELCGGVTEQTRGWAIRLGDSLAHDQEPSIDRLQRLACLRALLFTKGAVAEPGFLLPAGSGWAAGSIAVSAEVLRRDPTAAGSARLLAAVVLGAASLRPPAYEPRSEKALAATPLLHLLPAAEALLASVRAGVRASDVMRACTSILLDVGDIEAARDCAQRGLDAGADSTWHLIHLAYLDFLRGDTTRGVAHFDDAAAVARTPEARLDFARHLDWERGNASARDARRWLVDSLTPAGVRAWIALADSAGRMAFLHQRERQAAATSHLSLGAILTSHFAALAYARGGFHDCLLTLRAAAPMGDSTRAFLPCHPIPDPDLHLLPVTATVLRYWHPADGTPAAVATYAVPLAGLAVTADASGDRIARMHVAYHAEQVDTGFDRQVRLPSSTPGDASVTGAVALPVSAGAAAWSFTVAQNAHDRGTDDGTFAATGDSALALSDLFLGTAVQQRAWIVGADTIPLLPLNALRRTDPLELFLQVRSAQADTAARLTVAVYRVRDGTREEDQMLQIEQTTRLGAGLTSIRRTIDPSRLNTGTFLVTVTVASGKRRVVVEREVRIRSS